MQPLSIFNLDLAKRLIHPLKVGDVLINDWRIQSVDIIHDDKDYRKDMLKFTLSSDLKVSLSSGYSKNAAMRSDNFTLSVESSTSSPLTLGQRTALRALTEYIQANDKTYPEPINFGGSDSESEQSEAILWLIPGHIGNPLDLSLRSLRVLPTLKVIFVEEGLTETLQNIFSLFDLSLDNLRIVELDCSDQQLHDTLREQVECGGKVGVFGVSQGLPGDC